MSMIADIHFAVGSTAVVAGFLAMFVGKGTPLHKRAGATFAVSMVLLCLSGFYLSYSRDLQFTYLLSALALYLVVTGWLAGRPRASASRRIDSLGLAYSVLLCVVSFGWAIMGSLLAWEHPGEEPPFAAYALIGICAGLCLFGDLKYLRASVTTSTLRHKRHLTRMCSSMLIATTIFFLGNNNVLPEPMRTLPVLLCPILLVIAVLLMYRVGYPFLIQRKRQWAGHALHAEGAKAAPLDQP